MASQGTKCGMSRFSGCFKDSDIDLAIQDRINEVDVNVDRKRDATRRILAIEVRTCVACLALHAENSRVCAQRCDSASLDNLTQSVSTHSCLETTPQSCADADKL